MDAAMKWQRQRSLRFLNDPGRWPHWPFLPLIKRQSGQPDVYGVLFDAYGKCGLTGYSATVLLTNMYCMPARLDALLALPREVFDTRDEVVDAGWCVD